MATGLLSGLVSRPPYWLNPIWPPSGIGLAAAWLGGRRSLIASALGMAVAFVITAWIHYGSVSPWYDRLLGSALLALVFALQLTVATGLLRRFVPSAHLIRPQAIFAFLLVAGPVQGLVSALLGPLMPIAFGAWPVSDYGRIAFDWWRSEVLGGFSFSVILLCFAAGPREIWKPRIATVALPMAFWVAVCVALFLFGPISFPESGDAAKLWIESVASLVAFLFAGLLLVVSGQAAAVREEADRIASDLYDATAAKQSTESTLVVIQNRLELAQTIARIGAWEWDPVRDRVVWSDMMYRLVGYEPGSIAPTFANFLKCVHPEDRGLVEHRLQAAIRNELPYEYDFRVVHPDGTVLTLHAQARIERDADGNPIFWRGTDQDVTERVKAVEDQRRLDERLRATQRWESLGQLAGGVAHDFNNLMAGVLGHASLARESLPAESPLHELLRPVEEAAHHASSLCKQLLTYAGMGDRHRLPIDFRKFVFDHQELLRLGLPKSIELRIDATQGLPPVEGDESQLKQVLMNLVWNAVDAIGSNTGTIDIRTGTSRGGNCPGQYAGHFCSTLSPMTYVWFEVRDTGAGIDPAILGRLFDPFFTTKDNGRGLGLSAVAGIVRAHRGVVCVSSRPGVGSCFRVYLAAHDDPSITMTPRPVVNTPRQIPTPPPRETVVQFATVVEVDVKNKAQAQ